MADIVAEDADLSEESTASYGGDESYDTKKRPANTGSSNIKNILKRILIGICIILAGVGLFFLGGILGSGESIALLDSPSLKAENNNKLVYISGAPAEQEFTDPLFNIASKGLGLERIVEMYQWAQENDQFIKKWSEEVIALEGDEAKTQGYSNPTQLPFHSEKWHTDKVAIGSFALSPDLAKQLKNSENLPLTTDSFSKLNAEGQKAFKLDKDSYFFGINPEKPNVGDLRVTFKISPASPITVLAKQSGESLEVFLGKNGPIGIVRPGKIEADVIQQGIDLGENPTLKWAMRGVSLLFFIVGLLVIKGRKKKLASLQDSGVISHNEMYIEEEAEPTISENLPQNEPENQEQPAEQSFERSASAPPPPPAYDNYTEEGKITASTYISDYSALPPVTPPVADAPPAFKAPESLDFTPSSPAPDSGITSTLQQFGIMADTPPDSPASEIIEEAPEPQQPASIEFTTSQEETAPAPQSDINYSGNEYAENTSEEMPFEVEVISEDTMDQEPAFIEPAAAPVELSLAEPTAPAATEPSAPNLHDPIHYANTPEEMPEGVEIISEDSLSMPVPEAKSHEVATETDIQEAPQEASPEISDAATIAYDAPEIAAPLLPPVPDYDSLFVKEPSAEPATPEASPLPPKPDFDKLFGAEPISTPAPIAEPALSASFELPAIPDDFDPNAEMTSEIHHEAHPDLDADHFADDDGHSPFGDAEDDPFAHHDEDKK